MILGALVIFIHICRLKIWSLGDDSLVARAKIYHNEEITCMSATSNGRLLVTGSKDQSLKIWDIDTGFLTQVLVGHDKVRYR